jgi:hypothetical protein
LNAPPEDLRSTKPLNCEQKKTAQKKWHIAILVYGHAPLSTKKCEKFAEGKTPSPTGIAKYCLQDDWKQY